MKKLILGLLTALCSAVGATTFVYNYDADGRLLSTKKSGDTEAYSVTPAHNISNVMAMGDANTNNMPDSLELWLAGFWSGGDYNPFTCDSDGDGMCDFNEWTMGTDPFSFDSLFSAWPYGGGGSSLPSGPIDFEVTWFSTPFRTYGVEFRDSLMNTNWVSLTNSLEATPPVNNWTHEQTTNVYGFYRVILETTNTVVESTNTVEEAGE